MGRHVMGLLAERGRSATFVRRVAFALVLAAIFLVAPARAATFCAGTSSSSHETLSFEVSIFEDTPEKLCVEFRWTGPLGEIAMPVPEVLPGLSNWSVAMEFVTWFERTEFVPAMGGGETVTITDVGWSVFAQHISVPPTHDDPEEASVFSAFGPLGCFDDSSSGDSFLCTSVAGLPPGTTTLDAYNALIAGPASHGEHEDSYDLGYSCCSEGSEGFIMAVHVPEPSPSWLWVGGAILTGRLGRSRVRRWPSDE